MTDLTTLLTDADPARSLADLDLTGPADELLDELVARPDELDDELARRRSLRTRLLAGVAVAAAITAAVAVPGLRSGPDPSDPSGPAAPGFTPAALKVAASNPRVLVDLPGWKVAHVYGFEATEGTVVYGDGTRDLEVNWLPAKNHDGLVRERTADASRPVPITLAGEHALLFRYGVRDFAVITEPQDGVFTELRTGVHGWRGRTDVLGVLAHVRGVDVRTWLDAMPALVTTPGAIPAAIHEILREVPVPPGYDPLAPDLHGVYDQYQLTVQVIEPLICGWVDAWGAAAAAGDRAGVRAAKDALGSTRGWPALRRIAGGTGEYAQGVWPLSDEVRAGTVDRRRAAESLGCP